MVSQIAEDVKDARLQELQNLLKDQQLAFNQNLVGQTLPILFDGVSRGGAQLHGRSPFAQSTYMDIPPVAIDRLIGQEIMVKITSARQNSLSGEMTVDLI